MPRIEIENRTPHPINLLMGDVEIFLPAVHPTPRVQLTAEVIGHLRWDGGVIPVRRTRLHPCVTELPAREQNRLLVVSRMVAEAVPDRDDLVYPDEVVRNGTGAIVGCHALAAASATRWTGQTVTFTVQPVPAADGD